MQLNPAPFELKRIYIFSWIDKSKAQTRKKKEMSGCQFNSYVKNSKLCNKLTLKDSQQHRN